MSTVGDDISVSTAIWLGQWPQRASLERVEGEGNLVLDPEWKVELGMIATQKTEQIHVRRMP
jgi:hypothetical protein